MSPRTVSLDQLDLSKWPTIAADHLGPIRGPIVRKREKALRMYIEHQPLATIYDETGIRRQKVHALFKRALKLHADGEIQGFRACLYYQHVEEYVRVSPAPRTGKSVGRAGMFRQFLKRHPTIEEGLRELLFKTDRSKVHEVAISPKDLYESFLELCTTIGINGNQYPLNTDSAGDSSLARTIKKWKEQELHRTASIYYGVQVARKLGSGVVDPKFAYALYQRWEFDGHKIDGHFTIIFQLPDGRIAVQVLHRIWLLVVRDCGSAAIVGHHIVLRTEYNSEDVLTCIENAIIPWKPRPLAIQGLQYPPDGGLPSGCIPGLEYAYCNELTWDNAKANGQKIESWVWTRIKQALGCQVNPGPVAAPDQRLVENLFRILARNGFQRMPGTTGNNPKDPRCRKNAEKQAIHFQITADEIEELSDVIVADFNGTLSDATPGHSPLERLKFVLGGGKNALVRQIPEKERPDFCLTIRTKHCTVRGPIEKGHRPHINLLGVVYSSPKLCASTSLLQKKLLIKIWTRDLRTVLAFYPNGAEFGRLIAEGGWSLTRHDIRVRRAILKLRRQRKIHVRSRADPIKIYHRFLTSKMQKNRRARNEFAHARRVSNAGPVQSAEVTHISREGLIKPKLPTRPLNPPLEFRGLTF